MLEPATPRSLPKIPTLIARASAMLRDRFGTLILFGVAARLLWALIIGPVSSGVIAYLIARKGQYSFGNNDILSFALSPIGIITILLAATLIVFAQTAEIAGLLLLGRDPESDGPAFARAALRTGKAAPRIFSLAGWQCVILGVCLAPFLALVALAFKRLWSQYDLNYLVQVKPPEFWTGASIAGALLAIYAVIAAWFFVRWIYSLPIVLFERKPALRAMKESALRVKGEGWPITRLVVAWLVVSIALNVVTLAILRFVSLFVLSHTRDSVPVAIVTSAILLALHAVVISAVGFVSNALGAFLLLQLFDGEASSTERGEEPIRTLLPRRWVLLGTALGIAAVAGSISVGLIASLHVDDDIQVTAHRGSHRFAPENTVAAFQDAVEIGADFGELDVQLSKDGYVVVAHDEDLMRLLNLNRKIRDMTLAELRAVDFAWKTQPTYRGTHVPLLEEIFDAVGDRLHVMVEIKVYPGDNTPELVAKTIEIIRKKKFEKRCLVISLSYEALQRVREIAPELKLSYLVGESVGNLSRLNVDVLGMRAALATQFLVNEARRRGKAVHGWTIDDEREMVRLWDRGVANVISNQPVLMMKTRETVRKMTDVERLLLRSRYLLGGR